tara:strand:+ start:1648 stop:2001 length:354 start_codon:yes stop_codon:yes gene_type:complete
MGARGTKNGQRKKYTLDDGRVVDVLDVSKTVNCSLSLALARLNTSTDPKYIFLKKGVKLDKKIHGFDKHPYCIGEKKRKAKTQKVLKAEKNIEANRSAYDPLWQLIMKTIGKPYDRI